VIQTLDKRTRTRIWARSVAEVGYVATVAVVALIATRDPNHLAYPAFDVAIGMCLPSLVLLYPVFLAVVGNVWNVTGADHGGVTWPVTAAYVAAFSTAAVLNVGLVTLAIRSYQRRRATG
jgi:hypothetical protein